MLFKKLKFQFSEQTVSKDTLKNTLFRPILLYITIESAKKVGAEDHTAYAIHIILKPLKKAPTKFKTRFNTEMLPSP